MKKNIIVAFFSLILATAFAQDDNRIVVGDMNGDGTITIEDIRELSNIVLGKIERKFIPAEVIKFSLNPNDPPPAKKKTVRHYAGDIDGDGTIDVGDITILTELANGSSEYSYIYPDVVYDTLGIKNSHEYIDLGLNVKWAIMNVGATTIYAPGDKFAWAEICSKECYDWETYTWMESGQSSWDYVNKYTFPDEQYTASWYDDNGLYCGQRIETIELADDAAQKNWGGDWRMPTFDEWYELKTKCTWRWTSSYNNSGIKGYIVTSKIAGYTDKSIFLPVTGYTNRTTKIHTDTHGHYWTSSISTSASDCAASLGFNSSGSYWYDLSREYGQAIRPVRP